MRPAPVAALALLSTLPVAGPAPAAGASSPLGVSTGEREALAWDGAWRALADPRLDAPAALAFGRRGESAPLPLPFTLRLGGAAYDHVVVHDDGSLALVAASLLDAGMAELEAGTAALEDLLPEAAPPGPARLDVYVRPGARAARVVAAPAGEGLAVRWIDLARPGERGRGATVEALLHPTAGLRYQYYALPPAGPRPRVGWSLPGSEGLVSSAPRPGAALDLLPASAAPPAAEAADCSACPAGEPTWLQQLAASGRVCAPTWDGDGDGVADGAGCSCNLAGTSCSTRCPNGPPVARGTLRSTPTTLSDTRWQFDEGAFCVDCPYTFYVLVECGTEMHLPLSDMEGARLRVTEVLTGAPIPVTCENQAAKPGGLFFEGCGPPTTRYLYPPFAGDNAADPTVAVAWGFGGSCSVVNELDANRDGRLTCGVEIPENPGGTIELATLLPGLSPGDQQVMDCRVGDADGLCGVYRLDVDAGGFLWELFSNCAGDSSENFRIFDSCADACAAFDPLPELALDAVAAGNCTGGVDVSFELVNLGCAPAATLEYRIETSCPTPDVQTGSVPGPLGPNERRSWSDRLASVSCPAPFSVTVTVDPGNALLECTESPGAARCSAIPGQDSAVVTACGCLATVAADLAASAPEWCAGGAPPQLSAAASSASGCASGQLEFRFWKDAVGSGPPLTGWQASPAHVPGAEAGPGANAYAVEVRCAGEAEACAGSASTSVTQRPSPSVDLGADRSACAGSTVALDASGPGLSCLWSTFPAGQLVPGSETTCTPASVPLGAATVFFVTVTDAGGCTASDAVSVGVDPLPVADAGPPATLCPGAAARLGGAPTASGGSAPYAFLWTSSPPGLVTPGEEGLENPSSVPLSVPASFTVEVTDARGCRATGTVAVAVDAPPAPASLGNSLRAVRDVAAAPQDALLSWSTADPVAVAFRLRRGSAKASSYPPHPAAGDLPAQGYRDPGAAGGAESWYYQASALNCAGTEGP